MWSVGSGASSESETRRRLGTDRGQATITYLLAIVLSMVVFVLMANLLMFLYARGVVRAAVDEGARAGAAANASVAECEARAWDALDDLLGGSLGSGVSVTCSSTGAEVTATADVVLSSPFAGFDDWVFTAVATANDESALLP